jgi:hypothetical protein
MAPNDRVEALTRHLTSAMAMNASSSRSAFPDFCPVEMHRFLTRDNYELRQQIANFLKVITH